jgi:hypothetical protein
MKDEEFTELEKLVEEDKNKKCDCDCNCDCKDK